MWSVKFPGRGAASGPSGLEAQASKRNDRSWPSASPPDARPALGETGIERMMHPRTRMAEDAVMQAPDSVFEPLATLSRRLECRRGQEFGTSFGHTSPGMTGQPKRGRRAATRAPLPRGGPCDAAGHEPGPTPDHRAPSSPLPFRTVSPAARGHLTFAGATETPGPSRHRFVRAVGRDY